MLLIQLQSTNLPFFSYNLLIPDIYIKVAYSAIVSVPYSIQQWHTLLVWNITFIEVGVASCR